MGIRKKIELMNAIQTYASKSAVLAVASFEDKDAAEITVLRDGVAEQKKLLLDLISNIDNEE